MLRIVINLSRRRRRLLYKMWLKDEMFSWRSMVLRISISENIPYFENQWNVVHLSWGLSKTCFENCVWARRDYLVKPKAHSSNQFNNLKEQKENLKILMKNVSCGCNCNTILHQVVTCIQWRYVCFVLFNF